jgi:hypothetical protein
MNLKMLSNTELHKLNTRRLLGCLITARAVEQAEQHRLAIPYTDEYDGFYLGREAWEELILKPTVHLTAYKNRIKKILESREHIE